MDDSNGIVTTPSHEAAAVGGAFGGQQPTVIYAACDVRCRAACRHGHNTAVGAVAADAAVDDGANLAVGDGRRTRIASDESGSKLA